MKRISPERKAATLAKLLPPYNMAVAEYLHSLDYLFAFHLDISNKK